MYYGEREGERIAQGNAEAGHLSVRNRFRLRHASSSRFDFSSVSSSFFPFFSHSYDHCVPLDNCILFSFFPRFFFSSPCIFASHEHERPINFSILVRDPRGHYIQPNNTHINQHCFLSLASLRDPWPTSPTVVFPRRFFDSLLLPLPRRRLTRPRVWLLRLHSRVSRRQMNPRRVNLSSLLN